THTPLESFYRYIADAPPDAAIVLARRRLQMLELAAHRHAARQPRAIPIRGTAAMWEAIVASIAQRTRFTDEQRRRAGALREELAGRLAEKHGPDAFCAEYALGRTDPGRNPGAQPEDYEKALRSTVILYRHVLKAPRDDATIMVKWLDEHAVEI